jgi:hypothetical protein
MAAPLIQEATMHIFILAALMAFGGYAITIPRLIFDEWVQKRRSLEEGSNPNALFLKGS